MQSVNESTEEELWDTWHLSGEGYKSEAWTRLYERVIHPAYDYVVRVTTAKVGDLPAGVDRRDFVLDVVADSMKKSIDTYNPTKGAKFSTWWVYHAKYTALNLRRSHRLHAQRSAQDVSLDDLAVDPVAVENADTDATRLLEGLIQQLSPQDAELVYLLALGYSRKMVADMLDMPDFVLRKRLSRIRRRLRMSQIADDATITK